MARAKKTATPAKAAGVPTAPPIQPSLLPFSKRLVLAQYLLGTLGVHDFEQLRGWLKDPEREGVDEEGISRFARTLLAQLPTPDKQGRIQVRFQYNPRLADHFEAEVTAVSASALLRWDSNIVRHTRTLSRARGRTVVWKYFQYLALLVVEVYLDRWFTDAEALCAELNAWVMEHNQRRRDNLRPYTVDDLRTLALWCATGSGKTLLLHMNVLQFRDALRRHGRRRDINRTLLVTPGEALSRQHLDELARSGIAARAFDRKQTGDLHDELEVLESSKLAEVDGDKTVAVGSFEEHNLVFIDEGHHGAGGEVIRAMRDRLSAKGFAFEYSATFGQAMKAAKKPALEQAYAKAVVFDYAYRRFHADGFGKDFRVLNIDDAGEETLHHRYLVAALLGFYQQVLLYEKLPPSAQVFQIERPLWIFVGASVNAVRLVRGKKVSDVQRVLHFLSRFVESASESVEAIKLLLAGTSGLHDAKGHDLFENQFAPLAGSAPESVYRDVLQRVFHVKAPAKVHVERLEGTDGEIALRLGAGEVFGLINVGDASGLMKLLKGDGDRFVTTVRPVAFSEFDRLRKGDSTVNVLIGAQKFATGWDTARVSTMGLLNIGKGEGSQIIQLFGRGVRLRGLGDSLKRSRSSLQGSKVQVPNHLRHLETLQVFGVSADYMAVFEQYLKDEEVEVDTDAVVDIPVTYPPLPDPALKTLRVQDGDQWVRLAPRPKFGEVSEYLFKRPVRLDWYPRLRAMQSDGVYAPLDAGPEQEAVFGPEHVAFLDLDALVASLDALRSSKGWGQIAVSREGVAKVLQTPGWYALAAPTETLSFDDPARVSVWQEIAAALLAKYLERLAKVARATWERDRIEYAPLTASDPNLQLLPLSEDKKVQGYQVTVSKLNETLWKQVQHIAAKKAHQAGEKLAALDFDRHLFTPLLWLPAGRLTELSVKPVALNEGEGRFVRDLQKWYAQHGAALGDKSLYLLRNRAVAGVGFFDEGGFYPDFIVWVTDGEKQAIGFVDPKGIRNLETLRDHKIQLHKDIKQLQERLGDASVTLDSFIVSNTSLQDIHWKGDDGVEDFAAAHVFFQDRPDYVQRLMKVLGVG